MMLLSPFYSSPGSTVSEARPELDSQWPHEARSSGRSLVHTIAGKKKLLQKQAAGKKKMQAIGKVNVLSEPWRQIPFPVVDITLVRPYLDAETAHHNPLQTWAPVLASPNLWGGNSESSRILDMYSFERYLRRSVSQGSQLRLEVRNCKLVRNSITAHGLL